MCYLSASRHGVAALSCLLIAACMRSAPVLAAGNWSVGIGAGVISGPEYIGAEDNDTIAVPALDLAYRDRVFFNFYEGAYAYPYVHGQFRIKTGIGYERGRDSSDDASLAGLPDVGDAILAKLGAEYRLGRYTAFATLQRHYGGTDGGQLETGIQAFYSLREEITSPRILLNFAAVFSNDDYMDGFFGVDENAAAATGFPAYTAEAGPSAARAGVTLVVPLSKKWRLTSLLQYSRLVGDATDSPLVAERDQVFGGAFVGYRF